MGSPGAETDYKVFVGGISWNMTDEGLMDGGWLAERAFRGSAQCRNSSPVPRMQILYGVCMPRFPDSSFQGCCIASEVWIDNLD
jgi:hypothetical protein